MLNVFYFMCMCVFDVIMIIMFLIMYHLVVFGKEKKKMSQNGIEGGVKKKGKRK